MRLDGQVAIVVGAGQTPGAGLGRGHVAIVLASDEANSITRRVLPVDGSQRARIGQMPT